MKTLPVSIILYYLMQVNLGGLLAWEFLLFHWVELRRWQDIQNHHSVDQDPIFKNNRVHPPFLCHGTDFDPSAFRACSKISHIQKCQCMH
jgi:hypothetical protein